MQTEHAGEALALRESVGRFLAERAPLAWVRERWEHAAKIDGRDDPVWRGLVALGLPGLLVPPSQDGVGCGMVEMGAVLEEMGRFAHASPFLGSAVGATAAALALDAGELAARLASGAAIATLALEEPGAPFAAWRSPAARVERELVSGRKVRVADAPSVDVFLVTAGDAVYQVERDAAGLAIDPERSIDGSRSSATVCFDRTPARRLGPIAALAPALDRLFAALAADGLGAAQAALDAALAYARERRQFGVPIGTFQAVSHLLVDMLHAVELGRGAVHHALWALDAEPQGVAHRAALVAKAWASEAFPKVGADAIQVFGGIGFTWEHDAHLWYKRLLGLELSLGGASACHDELAASGIG